MTVCAEEAPKLEFTSTAPATIEARPVLARFGRFKLFLGVLSCSFKGWLYDAGYFSEWVYSLECRGLILGFRGLRAYWNAQA